MLLALLSTPVLSSMGDDAIEIIFSQEIVAIDSSGTPYEPTIIDPELIPGISSYDFNLEDGRNFRIVTNLPDAQKNEFLQIAETVKRSYDFVEKTTGGILNKGVLLYLFEFDVLPIAYRFEATYSADAPWQEVRVVLLNRGESLLGPTGSTELSELLYDTLPHELGHDVLADISPLLHDIDGAPSHHTRWFIEGVCEFIAKEFAQREAPEAVNRFLAMRNVDAVLNDDLVRNSLFNWSQQNNNGMALESNLYGASMLLMMAWTETIELNNLLARLNQCSSPQCGLDLEQLMEATTGLSRLEIINRAHRIGEMFAQPSYLAKRIAAIKLKG